MLSQTFKLERGAHVAHFFENLNAKKAVALPFLVDGLARGESCVYITGRQTVDDWYFELQAAGVDVQHERARGSLEVISGTEYHGNGEFNTIVQARRLLELIGQRRDFPAVRIAGHAAWESEPPVPPGQVCHWEAAANIVLEGLEVRTICQYDVGLDSPAVLHSALRTHPTVIVSGGIKRNPHYEAPRILASEPHLNESDIDGPALKHMLRSLMAKASE